MSVNERIFYQGLKGYGIERPVKEYRFYPTRHWRFDYAWPDLKIAAEIEGGAWIQGRHTRGSGFVKDLEKYNMATMEGWSVLRIQPNQLASAAALVARTALNKRGK